MDRRPNVIQRHPWLGIAIIALCYLVASYEPPPACVTERVDVPPCAGCTRRLTGEPQYSAARSPAPDFPWIGGYVCPPPCID